MGTCEDGTTSYNEEIVGEALKPYHDKVAIATKFGVHHASDGLVMDSRPEVIRTSIEGSLKKLQTDHVELYYQHRIDPKIPAEEVSAIDDRLDKMNMSGVFGGSPAKK